MPALNNENPPNERGFICRTIEEWIDLYGMSPPKRHALDKVPPTLQPLADGPYRWLFQQTRLIGYDGRTGLSIRSIVNVIQSHDGHQMQPLDVPEDWKDAVSNKTLNTTTAILQTSLCQYVDNMHRVWPSVSVLVYRPGSYFSTIPYPKPNLTLHELRDPDMPLYSVEWTVFKTLCEGNSGLTVYSELGPRPYYDALLPAICHQIPGCTVLRSTPIAFPSYSAESKSSTCLDFVCQPSIDNLPNDLPGGYIPVLFAAHHVDTLYSFAPSEVSSVHPGPPELMPDRRPGLVKLAKVFQPSLQLLVMHLTKKYRIDDHQWRPEWNPILGEKDPEWSMPDVPEKYFFFGMNYSKIECIIYTFFPRYTVTASGRVEWGFCCFETYRPWPIGGIKTLHRVHLINMFLRIQRHTAELAEIFRDISGSLGTPKHV